jgi:hypothetical protein
MRCRKNKPNQTAEGNANHVSGGNVQRVEHGNDVARVLLQRGVWRARGPQLSAKVAADEASGAAIGSHAAIVIAPPFSSTTESPAPVL